MLAGDALFTGFVIWAAIAGFHLVQGARVLNPAELMLGYSHYAIFFFSTFLTSVWAWAYALAMVVVRVMSSRFVERISNFERPFEWLAVVVAGMVFGLLMLVELARAVVPDDFDDRACAVFGGVICTHAARLTDEEQEIVARLTRACETGDPVQCRVALDRLATDEGPEAARLLERACDLNDDWAACISAGFLHQLGRGVAQDFARAHGLYSRTCESGEMRGCNNLGFLYHHGLGVARDAARARELYSRACEGWDLSGCVGLGPVDNQDSPRV